MQIKANLLHKPPSLQTSRCQVEKVVILPGLEFDQFLIDPQLDQLFIEENRELMHEWNGVNYCLLVLGEGRSDGVLVESEGHAQARYAAYVPEARTIVNAKLSQAADFIVRQSTANTSGGAWRVPFEKLEEQLGLTIRKGCGLDVLLKEALLDRKEIASAEISDDHIVMTCCPDFCPNLDNALDGGVHGSNTEHKRKLILHLDEGKYDTLQRALRLQGSDVEAVMQKRLEQCCREMVLEQKRNEISNTAKKEQSFLRIISGGKTSYFQLDAVETPEAASLLTHYLIQAPNTRPNSFENMFAEQELITEREFIDRTFEMLGYSKQVTGVFDVDLDGGTFSTLDADLGWRTYTAANIRAISLRFEERGITDKDQLAAAFQELPYSEQTANPGRLSLLSGNRSIKAEEITVSECLAEDDGVITFIVDVLADEQEVFGAELFTDEDSYFVFYAVYDTNTDQVSNELDMSLMRPAETIEFVCPIPPDTLEGLRQKMDDYCVAWSGKHLSEFGNQQPSDLESPSMKQRM